jgi:hypothetical protein
LPAQPYQNPLPHGSDQGHPARISDFEFRISNFVPTRLPDEYLGGGVENPDSEIANPKFIGVLASSLWTRG